jgi:hypothetical protein
MMHEDCWREHRLVYNLQRDWVITQEVNVTWVTVFGFPPSAETLIMQEFSRCGDILHFVSGRDDAVNWTHIQYAVSSSPSYMEVRWIMSGLMG